jgi:hypothetical protein
VLVEHVVEDLSLFWNQRIEGSEWIPRWIIPLPASMTRDDARAALLKEWILEFGKYHLRPNHIFIMSERASREVQVEFAQWLGTSLEGAPVKFVDVWPPTNRVPNVTAFESEKLIEIRRRGRRATWLRPQSEVAAMFGQGASWMVDLVEDARDRRSPFELFLPASRTTSEILNAPSPPTVAVSTVVPFGQGVDSINVRCTSREELVSHWLPTEKELLEELLSQHGLRFFADEKRACYLPALSLLGGLQQASSTLSGVRGAILQELAKRPATVDEIKGRLKLGTGKIEELNQVKAIESLFQHLTPTQKRLGRQRLRHYWRRTLPRDSKIQSLLEHWVSNSILRRLWRIGSCPECQTTHHETNLRIARQYRCPGCGASIPVAELLHVEYQLHPILRSAFNQGLAPVALTGNFLRNLTHRGFLWLPGLKYVLDGLPGDIDIVASCDGHLVLAECKTLEDSEPPKVEWPKIVDQVKALAAAGRACRASFVVLASMIEAYPKSVMDEVEAIADAHLPIHLLSERDLREGMRWLKEDALAMDYPMPLDDLLPEPFPEITRPKFDEPREFVTGLGTQSIATLNPRMKRANPPQDPIQAQGEQCPTG